MGPTTKADLCNCLAIRKAARQVTQLYDRHLAKSGLTVNQYSILLRLVRAPRTINELAAELLTDRTTMGRNIRPLERDGLVTITKDPRDARRRALAATARGCERVAAAHEGWADAQACFEAGYGLEPARHLRRALAEVVACDFDLPVPA